MISAANMRHPMVGTNNNLIQTAQSNSLEAEFAALKSDIQSNQTFEIKTIQFNLVISAKKARSGTANNSEE